MTLRTSIRLSAASAALAAVLVIAPAASASSDGHTFVLRRSAPTVVVPHGAHRNTFVLRRSAPIVVLPHAGVPAVPDRIDGIGSARGPQVVQVPSAEGGTSFDWSDALIGGAFLLGTLLLVAFTAASIGRRRGGLAMPS